MKTSLQALDRLVEGNQRFAAENSLETGQVDFIDGAECS